MPHRAGLLLTCAAALLTGCGNSRTPVPFLGRPAPAGAFRVFSYPSAGVSFRAPSTWTVAKERAPLVTLVTSGAAAVALWRFPRTQSLPSGSDQLQAARRALIAAARAQNGSLRVTRSQVLQVDGQGSIELDGTERIGGQLRRVRSTHVFAYGAEIVLDEYAPVSGFATVDHLVFSPLRSSLRISPTSK